MELFLVTIINCKQVISILNRLEKNVNLTPLQRLEVIQELKKHFKSCPIIIK